MQKEFQKAWYWLMDHPIFQDSTSRSSRFQSELYISFMMVNPETSDIDDDFSKNTKLLTYLEHGSELDAQGDTFEEAIIKLSNEVRNKYGDYGSNVSRIDLYDIRQFFDKISTF
jgi:hypothetical protein